MIVWQWSKLTVLFAKVPLYRSTAKRQKVFNDIYAIIMTAIEKYSCLNIPTTVTNPVLGIDEQIVKMTANASGIRDISRVLKISTDKVMSTLKKRKQT
jgi:hypothetical protein